jgi:hypothetical protein
MCWSRRRTTVTVIPGPFLFGETYRAVIFTEIKAANMASPGTTDTFLYRVFTSITKFSIVSHNYYSA